MLSQLETRDVPSVVYDSGFQGATTAGNQWSARAASGATVTPGISTTPVGNRQFLGQFGNSTATLSLGNLPAHDAVTISFDLYVINSWDGSDVLRKWGPDGWSFAIDGQSQLSTTFSNQPLASPGAANNVQTFGGQGTPAGTYPAFTGAAEVNTLGYTFYRGSYQRLESMDSVYRFTFTVPHIGDSVKFDFRGIGLQGLADESWGLDNVRVLIADVPLIQGVTWQQKAGETGAAIDNQPDGTPAGGKRAFAEAKSPDAKTVADEVEVRVQLDQKKADVTVYLRMYDVDDPSSNSATDKTLDDETLPADNRGTTGDLKSFTLKTDENGVAVGTVKLSRQPGDNFRVVATLDKDLNLETGVVVKQKDATAGVYTAGGDAVAAKSATTVASEPITVWRHLWIEQDHMAAPPEGEVFDDTEPRKDVKPDGAVADPKLDLAITNLRRAYVVVAAVPNDLNKRKDAKWAHNIGGSEFPTVLKDWIVRVDSLDKIRQDMLESSRDVHGTADFWAVQILAAYEPDVLHDQDPHSGAPTPAISLLPESWTLGEATHAGTEKNDAGAIVYMENIRDVVVAKEAQIFKWSPTDSRWVSTNEYEVKVATVDSCVHSGSDV